MVSSTVAGINFLSFLIFTGFLFTRGSEELLAVCADGSFLSITLCKRFFDLLLFFFGSHLGLYLFGSFGLLRGLCSLCLLLFLFLFVSGSLFLVDFLNNLGNLGLYSLGLFLFNNNNVLSF